MKKAIYIIILVVILIITWFIVEKFLLNINQENEENTEISFLTVETKDIIEDNQDKKYSIEVHFPVVKNTINSNNANLFIEEKINKIIQEFKKNVSDWDAPVDLSDMKSGLWINFEEYFLNNNCLSLKINVSEYYLGAAHPNNYSYSLNYNLNKAEEINLGNLFSVNQNQYLSRLSDLVLLDLEKQFEDLEIMPDASMLKSGTEAKEDNFKNFNLSQESLIFNFDQYQIAPYAAGEFKVVIPFSDLSDIINTKVLEGQ